MASRKPPNRQQVSVTLSVAQIHDFIPKLQRRIDELRQLNVHQLTEETGNSVLSSIELKANATIREFYPIDSIEYSEYSLEYLRGRFMIVSDSTDLSIRGNLDWIKSNVHSAASKLEALRDLLRERISGSAPSGAAGAMRAYEGLDLHPEIARAASRLFKDEHYANAIEAAVKALNGIVRLRSGLEIDGTSLMERAFSPANPILRFNQLRDQSDKDEQKGYMMLFSGAVSGLRNPRAHAFVKDEPERALEFIAFVSLLAKLVDEAEQ